MMRMLMTSAFLALGACAREEPTAAPPTVATRAPTTATIPTLPPDGKQLYGFLMREEPKLMAEVPCACCNLSLADCFQGACPET